MQVAPLSSGQTAADRPEDSSKAYMNYDSFLKLLIATMKNQDPTHPNDPAQTMSQLAAFSSVEQGIKANAKLSALLATVAAGQVNDLLGRIVSSADGGISGVVEALELGDTGLTALLRGGGRLPITSGVRIADR